MRNLTTGVAIAVFSDIRADRYSDEEKLEAIRIVLRLNRYGEVKKDAAFEVIKWMMERNGER